MNWFWLGVQLGQLPIKYADCRLCSPGEPREFDPRNAGRCPTCPREKHYLAYRREAERDLVRILGLPPYDPRVLERVIDEQEAIVGPLSRALRDNDWKVANTWDPEIAALAEVVIEARDLAQRAAMSPPAT